MEKIENTHLTLGNGNMEEFYFHYFKLVVWILQCSSIPFVIKILNKHLKIKCHSQIPALYLIINKHIRNGQQIEVWTLNPGALYLMAWSQWSLALLPNLHLNLTFQASKILVSTETNPTIMCLFAFATLACYFRNSFPLSLSG